LKFYAYPIFIWVPRRDAMLCVSGVNCKALQVYFSPVSDFSVETQCFASLVAAGNYFRLDFILVGYFREKTFPEIKNKINYSEKTQSIASLQMQCLLRIATVFCSIYFNLSINFHCSNSFNSC